MTATEGASFNGAQFFCPVCCSTLDVTDAEQTEFGCTTCGQQWTMRIDLDAVAAYGV